MVYLLGQLYSHHPFLALLDTWQKKRSIKGLWFSMSSKDHFTLCNICGPIVNISNSINNFNCWIDPRIVSFGQPLKTMKIVISSFKVGIEMQKLQGTKVSDNLYSL